MKKLIQDLRKFAKARNWEQFHSPKNLVMALSVEVAELMEHFQWMTCRESIYADREKFRDEIGDITIYLLMICDKFDLDPIVEAKEKIKKNAIKYPV